MNNAFEMPAQLAHERVIERLFERLLQGDFICATMAPDLYKALQVDQYKDSVTDLLYRTGRRLRRTGDGCAYYAPLLHMDTKERASAVRSQFRETINELESLVKWLEFVMLATRSGTTLQQGGPALRMSEIAQAVDESTALSERLAELTRSGAMKVNQDSNAARLKAVAKFLQERGYLVPLNGRIEEYAVTGKWSYLNEVIAFVIDHEEIHALDETESDITQGALL